ncbi:MAG TPA: apolipoprotein N-acyltransferase [Candidatus Omnitrophota bacterium]|nr:apolipoprotein N-acyltransferase [Candidatus Omnitrophota bacterium]HPS37045.1 apolipoprotein N-acyltransferase [Candidatus Omnitrophota bacterium]
MSKILPQKPMCKRLAFLSGLMLLVAFPYPGWPLFGWIALVPLLLAIRSARSLWRAVWYGWITGAVFFNVTMDWMSVVSVGGWIFFFVLEACFFAIFAALTYWGSRSLKSIPAKIVWTSAAWVFMEFVRTEIPVLGLGWNLLAFSQAPYRAIIQIADIVGAYGLSFFVMAVNVCVAKTLVLVADPGSCQASFMKRKLSAPTVMAALFLTMTAVIGSLFCYGSWSIAHAAPSVDSLRVSVLQGNIDQSEKWDPVEKENILQVYEELAQQAAADRSDLIVWPETSFPGVLGRDIDTQRVKDLASSIGVPMVVGALKWEGDQNVRNSAYFIDQKGVTRERYDKLKLVPFGEYIPARPVLFWMTPVARAMGIEATLPGEDFGIFQWTGAGWPFGVIICVEDVFPNLVRQLADCGCRFLVILTNDAWFEVGGAPLQHLYTSIFRAVENGIPVVRSANTGISGIVSDRGVVLGMVQDEKGQSVSVKGQITYDLPLTDRRTFYRRGGWLLPYGLGLIMLGIFFMSVLRRRTKG